MKLLYANNKIEKVCNDTKSAIKKYGDKVGKNLSDLILLLQNVSSLMQIKKIPQYRLHALKGNRKNQYAIVITFGSKYRLIIYPLDEKENIVVCGENENYMLSTIKIIKIMEVSEHYEI